MELVKEQASEATEESSRDSQGTTALSTFTGTI